MIIHSVNFHRSFKMASSSSPSPIDDLVIYPTLLDQSPPRSPSDLSTVPPSSPLWTEPVSSDGSCQSISSDVSEESSRAPSSPEIWTPPSSRVILPWSAVLGDQCIFRDQFGNPLTWNQVRKIVSKTVPARGPVKAMAPRPTHHQHVWTRRVTRSNPFPRLTRQ